MQDQPLIEPPCPQAAARSWRHLGLSAKLLLLTLAVIMLAEILIFVPSVANFRDSWLRDRLRFAEIAALVAEAAPEGRVPEALRHELLMSAQVKAVALKRKDMRMPLLLEDMPPDIAETFDLRTDGPIKRIGDALATLLQSSPRAIRVIGTPGIGAGEFVEIVMLEAPLKAAMVSFGLRVLGLSVFISVMAAAMVYLALNGLLVRPIERMVANMMRFSAHPEDVSRIIQPSTRTDEIGTAEHQLAAMQRELAQVLHQKTRLAALGLAVSKINHDLRNMLANAQLISDRFQDSSDPTVKRFAPKLIGSLDRAIRLCTDTLKFGRAEEEPPKRSQFFLRPVIEEAGEGLGLPIDKRIGFVIDVAEDLIVDADPNQLFRVLTNLLRNAAQVIDAATPRERIAMPDAVGQDLAADRPAGAMIWVIAQRLKGSVQIDVADSGLGIPEQARLHLFEAFQGSVRKGGTGLGLAICAEIMRAHGGAIELVQSGPDGTTFRLTFPDVER
jgi:signal transduction histidine kinase